MNPKYDEKPASGPASIVNEKYQEDEFISEVQVEDVHQGTASFSKAVFMLLKGFIGTGVLFLPGSFVSGGLVLSIVLMVIIAVLCLIATHLLCKAQLKTGGDYGVVAERLYGPYLKHLIHLFLCLSQMGFVASYLIFISENIGIVIESVNNCISPFDAKYFIWIALIPMIPFCWVRRIANLSYLAIAADIFISFGLICVLYFCSSQISTHGVGPNITMVNNSDFGLMIGTAVFSFEGIATVLPVYEGMRNPKRFPAVLTIGITVCLIVFTLIGTMGYVAYGDTTQASVVSNLPRIPLSVTVQIVYAVAMICSSPFMLFPALRIIEKYIFATRSGKSSLKIKWGKNFVRAMVPTVCAAVSFGVGSQNLSKFVSLVGSVACMPLCFIFPGLFHYKTTSNNKLKAVDIFLVVFGVACTAYTLYININSWVNVSGGDVVGTECLPIM